ncbi:hypothetical protein AgCh_014589 [Apium graveolens]
MGLAYCLTASWWTPNLADWRSQELGSMGQLNHDDQITVGERYSDEYVIVYTNGRTVQGHRVILSTSKVDILIRAKVQGAFSTYRMLYPTAGTITKSSSASVCLCGVYVGTPKVGVGVLAHPNRRALIIGQMCSNALTNSIRINMHEAMRGILSLGHLCILHVATLSHSSALKASVTPPQSDFTVQNI